MSRIFRAIGAVFCSMFAVTLVQAAKVATPAFTPAAGTYTSAQTITITSATSGSSIRYTLDGTTPSSTTGVLYGGPVSIGATTTLKAIAFKTGLTDSSIASGVYTISAAAPTFSPGAGTYTTIQSVSINSSTTGASIRYTTDGSTPSETMGILYVSGSPVSISTTTTLKAIAFKTGFTNSTVTSGVYTINLPPAGAPTFSPAAGTYTTIQSVSINSTTTGASIRYTTDGSTPTATVGTLYSSTSPITIGVTTTLKAVAFKTGFANSTVTSGVYTINLPATGAPTFSPTAGTYTTIQSVSINSTTTGASIRYTTDGSTPTTTVGTLYSSTSPVTIGVTTTLKAIAFKTGFANSTVTSGVYTINLPVAGAPTFSPAAGTYTSVQSVAISSTTSGASIRYTIDGSIPSATAGILYSSTSPVSIGTTTTLKAIAFKTGFTNSSVTSGVYTINLPASAPIFSPPAGIYSNAQPVTISTTTSGASLRYTIDGSTPTQTNGALYSGPVNIGATTTLKAIAYKSGVGDSPVTSGAYNMKTAAPIFDPVPGVYEDILTISMSSETTGAFIRYTTDGSIPTSSTGTIYGGAISVASGTTLQAVAYRSGFADSTISGGTYTFRAAMPTFRSIDQAAHTVAIESTTAGVTIRYTTDGSPPTQTNGTIYAGPVTITGPTPLAAVAYGNGFSISFVANVNISVPTITISTPAHGSTVNGP